MASVWCSVSLLGKHWHWPSTPDKSNENKPNSKSSGCEPKTVSWKRWNTLQGIYDTHSKVIHCWHKILISAAWNQTHGIAKLVSPSTNTKLCPNYFIFCLKLLPLQGFCSVLLLLWCFPFFTSTPPKLAWPLHRAGTCSSFSTRHQGKAKPHRARGKLSRPHGESE